MKTIAKQTTQSSVSFSPLFPSIHDSCTSQLSTCPAKLPWSFQINPLQLFPNCRYNQTNCFGLSSQACNSDCWPSNICLDYLCFGSDRYILIPFILQNFMSNMYFLLQNLSIIHIYGSIWFPSKQYFQNLFFKLELFCLFLVLCDFVLWDRVYLHSSGHPEFFLPLPSKYWD